MSNVIISVKDLHKKYGSFHAVKGINFEVFEGEIFGLLGPNGAGKSTTLEIIETLRDKTSGTIHVAGFNLDKKNNWGTVTNIWILSKSQLNRINSIICWLV